ncbi:uncharacterized protein LOC143911931 [Arctopsyche grandis]|uniref:uncharacterized protein LOC143911931 n=1 Tax=Arctopsyche grandis TaxID=121162 RepID=UPI00406D7797
MYPQRYAEKGNNRGAIKFKGLFHLMVILGTAAAIVAPECCDCPDSCVCKWITGKMTAICISAGFTDVPSLSSDTQVLNLNSNNITYLKADAFGSAGLVNLQKIFIKHVTLREMHRDSFKNMTILVEINMSDNYLSSIPKGAFEGNVRLKILILSGNPLKILPSGQFPTLPCLRTLELESCQLQTIEDSFVNLNALEILNLKLNNLQSASKEIFANLTNLKSLALEGNPWRCDCELKIFRDWYLSSNLPSLSPICYQPEIFNQKLWTSIASEDFACLPKVQITNGDVVYKDVGENMTLSCNIVSNPEPVVLWLFNGVPIAIGVNESFTEDVSVEILIDGSVEKWSNLSIRELNEYNFGHFVCLAKSAVYLVEAKSLVSLPVEEDPPVVVKGHAFWFLFTGVSILGLVLFVLATSAVACGCMTYSRTNKIKKQDEKTGDPEKRLLDVSSSHSRKSSCEKLDSISGANESVDRFNSNLHLKRPDYGYVTAFPVFPVPPPEQFSNSMARSRTLGNVYQYGTKSRQYRSRPDVDQSSDVVCKARKCRGVGSKGSSSVFDVSVLPFATLPRKHFTGEYTSPITKYDNMGKRISVRGSSTMSFQDIPPPPPPPLSSKSDFEFVPL